MPLRTSTYKTSGIASVGGLKQLMLKMIVSSNCIFLQLLQLCVYPLQVLTGATAFYAFHDVYVELMRAGTPGGNHVTRRHLVTPSAVTVAVMVVATLGVTSTTTLTSPVPKTNWTSGAPLAESFDLSDVTWIKYVISALAIVALLPVSILQVRIRRVVKPKQESPAVADKPARRLRKVRTVYV